MNFIKKYKVVIQWTMIAFLCISNTFIITDNIMSRNKDTSFIVESIKSKVNEKFESLYKDDIAHFDNEIYSNIILSMFSKMVDDNRLMKECLELDALGLIEYRDKFMEDNLYDIYLNLLTFKFALEHIDRDLLNENANKTLDEIVIVYKNNESLMEEIFNL